MSNAPTPEEVARAQEVMAAHQAAETARVEAERAALLQPITDFVKSEQFAFVAAEAQRIADEYPDERQYFRIFLNAIVTGTRNLASAVGHEVSPTAA